MPENSNDGYLTSAITGRRIAKLPTSDRSAADVSVADAGGYFTGTNVETVLQEIGAELGLSVQPYKRQLEYLESTGTQWIDSGLYSQDGYVYQTRISPTEAGAWKLFFGRQTTAVGGQCEYFGYGRDASSIGAFFANAGVQSGGTAGAIGTAYDIEMSSVPANKYVTINDTKTTSASDTGYSDSLHIYLFGINNAGEANNFAKIRLSYWRAFSGNIAVRDFIPVLDRQDVPCLFDKVTQQFFYNQGTGNFSYPEA